MARIWCANLCEALVQSQFFEFKLVLQFIDFDCLFLDQVQEVLEKSVFLFLKLPREVLARFD
jgi:hypothetical protein